MADGAWEQRAHPPNAATVLETVRSLLVYRIDHRLPGDDGDALACLPGGWCSPVGDGAADMTGPKA